LLTSVIFTWIVTYWWYHVVLHWCNKIVCRHLLASCSLLHWIWYSRIVHYWLPLRAGLLIRVMGVLGISWSGYIPDREYYFGILICLCCLRTWSTPSAWTINWLTK
jgi:hypothetical protein